MKNLTAIITDGMHNTDEVKVKSISVWINRNVNHTVNDESINELIKKGNESGQMHIYQYCISESLEGKINATEGTALYTNGQKTVDKLLLNGIEIWNRRKIKKELTEPVYNHIGTLNKEQLTKQKQQLENDIKLIETPGYFKGNCNDLLRIRNIELNYINYLIS